MIDAYYMQGDELIMFRFPQRLYEHFNLPSHSLEVLYSIQTQTHHHGDQAG